METAACRRESAPPYGLLSVFGFCMLCGKLECIVIGGSCAKESEVVSTTASGWGWP